MSAAFFRLFRNITFQAAQNTVALDMTNRIIKSLYCSEVFLIFFILKIDFTISVITLFVIFNKPFQKALVDKSVCVINIVHLIIMSAIKNPLFDVYFNRITALFALRFSPFMRTYLTSFALFAVRFLPFMRAYLTSFTLFAFRFSRVMRAYLRPFTLFAVRFLSVMSAYLSPFTLLTLIFVFLMFAKIFQIFLCSVFAHILITFFHFLNKKK